MTRPFFDFRDYLLSFEEFGDIIPSWTSFVPVGTQPEDRYPLVVYGTRLTQDADSWWMREEEVGLEIFSKDTDELLELMEFLADVCSPPDRAAQRLQKWAADNSSLNFVYHSLQMVGVGDMQPVDEQGGAYSITFGVILQYSPGQQRFTD